MGSDGEGRTWDDRGERAPRLRIDLVVIIVPEGVVLWPTAAPPVVLEERAWALIRSFDGTATVDDLVEDLVVAGRGDAATCRSVVESAIALAEDVSLLEPTRAGRPVRRRYRTFPLAIEELDRSRLMVIDGGAVVLSADPVVDTPDWFGALPAAEPEDLNTVSARVALRPAGRMVSVVSSSGASWQLPDPSTRNLARWTDIVLSAVISTGPGAGRHEAWLGVAATARSGWQGWELGDWRPSLGRLDSEEPVGAVSSGLVSSVAALVSSSGTSLRIPDVAAFATRLEQSHLVGEFTLDDVSREVGIAGVHLAGPAVPFASLDPAGRRVAASLGVRESTAPPAVGRWQPIPGRGPLPAPRAGRSSAGGVGSGGAEPVPAWAVLRDLGTEFRSVKVSPGSALDDRWLSVLPVGALVESLIGPVVDLARHLDIELGAEELRFVLGAGGAVTSVGYEIAECDRTLKVYLEGLTDGAWDGLRTGSASASARVDAPEVLGLKWRVRSGSRERELVVAEYRRDASCTEDFVAPRSCFGHDGRAWFELAMRLAGVEHDIAPEAPGYTTDGSLRNGNELLDVQDSAGRRSFDLPGHHVHPDVFLAEIHGLADLARLGPDARARLVSIVGGTYGARVIGGSSGNGQPFISLYRAV